MGRVINPDSMVDPTDRDYTHARVADGVLYVSGQVGWRGDGRLAGDAVEAQARQAFANLETILSEVDRDLGDVVKVRSYLTDIDRDFAAFKRVWAETFDEPYPCHTAIGVDGLATPDLLVELEAQAPVE